MKFKIAARLRPYSHLPGTYFILPGSSYRLQIYPTLIKIDDLSKISSNPLGSIAFDLKGPLEDFTVLHDLENGSVRVWGISQNGYFRYRLSALEDGTGLALMIEKAPEGLSCECENLWYINNKQLVSSGSMIILSHQTESLNLPNLYAVPKIDRLSLGSHKSQDWELIRRRKENLVDIFPIWHRLGQLVPRFEGELNAGTLSLLKRCKSAAFENAPDRLLAHYNNLFLAGFQGGLSPRLQDTDFQGFLLPELPPKENISPLQLLAQGAEVIRSLFIQSTSDQIHLLPALPTEFHCGRLLDVKCGLQGLLSMEWTKKALRCFMFESHQTGKISFQFSKGEKRCRLRLGNKDRGSAYLNGFTMEIISGQNYWFDNFEK